MFDLDGTLIDTMGLFADLAGEIMEARHGLDRVAGRRRYLETSGIPFRQQLEVIHPGDARNQAASDEFEDRKQALCADAVMDDDTLHGLEQLRALGMKLVVSSNAHQRFVDDFVRRERFRFDLALGNDPELGWAKGRAHVEYTRRILDMSTDEILFCGDSVKDAELAADTKLAFVARIGTLPEEAFRRHDPQILTIDRISQLSTLLRSRVAA